VILPADDHVGLDGTVRVPRNGVGVLKDLVRLGEAPLDVALPCLPAVRDVRVGFREEPRDALVVDKVRVDQLGALSHRPLGVEDGRQFLVVNLDQLRGAQRDPGITRDDGRYLFSHEPDTVLCEDVAVLHVETELVWEVLPCHDLDHTGNGLCLGRVDAPDERVRVRACRRSGPKSRSSTYCAAPVTF